MEYPLDAPSNEYLDRIQAKHSEFDLISESAFNDDYEDDNFEVNKNSYEMDKDVGFLIKETDQDLKGKVFVTEPMPNYFIFDKKAQDWCFVLSKFPYEDFAGKDLVKSFKSKLGVAPPIMEKDWSEYSKAVTCLASRYRTALLENYPKGMPAYLRNYFAAYVCSVFPSLEERYIELRNKYSNVNQDSSLKIYPTSFASPTAMCLFEERFSNQLKKYADIPETKPGVSKANSDRAKEKQKIKEAKNKENKQDNTLFMPAQINDNQSDQSGQRFKNETEIRFQTNLPIGQSNNVPSKLGISNTSTKVPIKQKDKFKNKGAPNKLQVASTESGHSSDSQDSLLDSVCFQTSPSIVPQLNKSTNQKTQSKLSQKLLPSLNQQKTQKRPLATVTNLASTSSSRSIEKCSQKVNPQRQLTFDSSKLKSPPPSLKLGMNFFGDQIRQSIKISNPDCSSKEINQLISSKWNKLSPIEKSDFMISETSQKLQQKNYLFLKQPSPNDSEISSLQSTFRSNLNVNKQSVQSLTKSSGPPTQALDLSQVKGTKRGLGDSASITQKAKMKKQLRSAN